MDGVGATEVLTGQGQELFVEQEEMAEMDWEPSSPTNVSGSVVLDKNVEEIRKLWAGIQSPASPAPAQRKRRGEEEEGRVFIVPDTNIWMGSLDLLKELLDRKLSNGTRPTLLIPWMVLQELDCGKGGIKSGKRDQGQTAIRFIHELLTAKHPRLLGQRATEAATSEDNHFQASNPDDQILLCALQCSARHPNAIVVLVTNDKNLLNKAMVETRGSDGEKVVVTDAGHLESKLKARLERRRSSSKSSSSQRPTLVPRRRRNKEERKEPRTDDKEKGPSPATTTAGAGSVDGSVAGSVAGSVDGSSSAKSRKRSHTWTSQLCQPSSKRPLTDSDPPPRTPQPQPDSFQSILRLLQDTFSHIIESEMKREFGDTWLFALKFKPPWSLESALKCILAHWIAVFSFVFGRNSSVHAQGLLDRVSQLKRISATKEQEEQVLQVAVSLFTVAKMSKSPAMKDSRVLHCRDTLLEYSRRSNT